MFETYEPSGRISPAVVPWLGVAFILTVAAAFMYQLGLHWIPIIYVNLLLTIVMGFVVGYVTNMVIVSGKVRNTFASYLVLILVAFTAIAAKFGLQYVRVRGEVEQALSRISLEQLQAEIKEKLPAEAIHDFRKMALDEYTFLNHIQQRVHNGWQVDNVGGGNGRNPISGVFVHIIWAIEAGTILYIANKARHRPAVLPFNERIGAWASENDVVMSLPVTNAEMVAKIEAATSVDQLLKLPIPQSDESNQFAVYTVHSIPGDEMEDAYLTVELQTLSVNSQGETETASKPLVRNAVLTTAQRAQLTENSEIMKEAFAAYRASLNAAQSTDPT